MLFFLIIYLFIYARILVVVFVCTVAVIDSWVSCSADNKQNVCWQQAHVPVHRYSLILRHSKIYSPQNADTARYFSLTHAVSVLLLLLFQHSYRRFCVCVCCCVHACYLVIFNVYTFVRYFLCVYVYGLVCVCALYFLFGCFTSLAACEIFVFAAFAPLAQISRLLTTQLAKRGLEKRSKAAASSTLSLTNNLEWVGTLTTIVAV